MRRDKKGRFECKHAMDRIEKAVDRLIRRRFAGIVRFGPWVHHLNTVLNCYALCLDGSIQYKFSLTSTGKLIVAEIRDRHWIDLPLQPSDIVSWDELEAMIPKAKTRDVFQDD